jgi:hypothetical protein
LAGLINKKTCTNTAEVIENGLRLNKVIITINEGIMCFAGNKVRFTDVWDLCRHLLQEGIFIGDMHDIRVIRESYFKTDGNTK